jgi:hypothetical protein
MGLWKNVPRTEYILVWWPDARDGQVWLTVEGMNGSGVFDWCCDRDVGVGCGCG